MNFLGIILIQDKSFSQKKKGWLYYHPFQIVQDANYLTTDKVFVNDAPSSVVKR